MRVGIKGWFSEFRLRNRQTGAEQPILGLRPNLITDAGLDMPATYAWNQCFEYAMIGTGSTPATYADTTLETQTHYTNTYSATSNGTEEDFTGRYIDLWRYFVIENATGSAIPFRELAVGPTSTATFNRVVLSSEESIPAGYDLIFKYTLRLSLAQWRTPTVETWTMGAVSIPGKFAIYERYSGNHPENILPGIQQIPTNGYAGAASADQAHLEPSAACGEGYNGGLRVLTSAMSELTELLEVTGPFGSGLADYWPTVSSYVAGNNYVDRVFSIPAADFTGNTLYGAVFNQPYTYYGGRFQLCQVFRFDAAAVKPTTATWTITNRLSWGRA